MHLKLTIGGIFPDTYISFPLQRLHEDDVWPVMAIARGVSSTLFWIAALTPYESKSLLNV